MPYINVNKGLVTDVKSSVFEHNGAGDVANTGTGIVCKGNDGKTICNISNTKIKQFETFQIKKLVESSKLYLQVYI